MNFESKHTVARWGHGGSDGHALPERNCRHHWPSHVAPSCLGVTWPFSHHWLDSSSCGSALFLFTFKNLYMLQRLLAVLIYSMQCIFYINCHYCSFVHHVMCRTFNCYLFTLRYLFTYLFIYSCIVTQLFQKQWFYYFVFYAWYTHSFVCLFQLVCVFPCIFVQGIAALYTNSFTHLIRLPIYSSNPQVKQPLNATETKIPWALAGGRWLT